MSDFATDLGERIRSHEEFWAEYRILRSNGARATLDIAPSSDSLPLPKEALQRLIFAASIFAQSSNETDHAVAQSIALSALVSSQQDELLESASGLLAQLGNFPGVHYLQQHYPKVVPDAVTSIQIHLLEALNTVEIFGENRALTDFQFDIWTALPYTKTVSISAPTSAGKSFVVIEYLCKQVLEREAFVGVYIAPTRALLSEVNRKINLRLSGLDDVRISTVPAIDPDQKRKQIYVLTQERLAVLLGLGEFSPDLLVVDEAQNLADGARGMILQDCIERVRDRNPNAQLLLLSPSTTGFPKALETLGINTVAVKETTLSPVLQNRIVVSAVPGKSHLLRLSLLEKQTETPIGTLQTSRGVDSAETRLATVALELGSGGGALVYATGPAEAEKVASRLLLGLPKEVTPELKELADFIRTHIHQDYGLATSILHGVAFHYGKMPSLLREALEGAFEKGHIKYLVCTTTLFQGVNLPARNVFINTPTRGAGVKLSPALLWNFAGRAGRLSRDVVGNVFLVDYNSWDDKPLDQMARLEVHPSLAKVLRDRHEEVVTALSGAMPKDKRNDDAPAQVRAAAGYLVARASRGSVSAAVNRLSNLGVSAKEEVIAAATEASRTLELSPKVLQENWTVDPFGLSRLKKKLVEKLKQDLLDDYIPCDPTEPNAYGVYAAIFNLIAREVWQWNATKLGGFVSNYAIQWMKGVPYPVLVSKWVKRQIGENPGKTNIDGYVRGAFEFIEDELRFKWVQHSRAYVDVLDDVLTSERRHDLRASVYDFSLALELGVSSRSARSFIELGLSRISAAALASLYPDSQLSVDKARDALAITDVSKLPLSPVIVREIEAIGLGLIKE